MNYKGKEVTVTTQDAIDILEAYLNSDNKEFYHNFGDSASSIAFIDTDSMEFKLAILLAVNSLKSHRKPNKGLYYGTSVTQKRGWFCPVCDQLILERDEESAIDILKDNAIPKYCPNCGQLLCGNQLRIIGRTSIDCEREDGRRADLKIMKRSD